jgi:phage terminase large subunit-like protein
MDADFLLFDIIKRRAKFQETINITRKNQIREIKKSLKSAIQTKGKVSQ